MAAGYRIVLHGFGRFEHDALFFCFKHADTGPWGYELVDSLEESDFIVADGDREFVDGSIASADRMDDTLFVCSKVPRGAAAYVMRPIVPQRILFAFDEMISRRSAAASVDSAQPIPASDETPNIMLAVEANDATVQSQSEANASDVHAETEEEAEPISLTFRQDFSAAPVTDASPDTPSPPVEPSPTHDSSTARTETVLPAESGKKRPLPDAGLVDAKHAQEDRLADAKSGRDPESKRASAKAAVRRAVRRARLAGRAAAAVADVLVLDSEPKPGHLCTLLEAFGFRVHRVSASQQAISAMHEMPLAAVFIDLVLSDSDSTDGLDLCLRIKQKQLALAGDVPVVVLVSGRATATARVQAKLAGCDAFLIQPVTRGDLARALENCNVPLPADQRYG